MAHRRKSVKQQSRVPKSKREWQKWQGDKFRPAKSNPKVARSVAKGITTKSIRNISARAVSASTADSLKKGVIGMGTVVNARPELMAKLRRMDAGKLAGLYEANPLLFESFYSYAGIDFDPEYGNIISDEKEADVRFFIEEYERVFGTL